MPSIKVIGDTIVPAPIDPYALGLTPREADVRTAFFILGFGVPIVGALFALMVNEEWWRRAYFWSYQRLCAIWFISVSAVALIVYALPGQGTRSTITTAFLHVMVENCIISLLLGKTASEGLIASMLLGLVGFSVTYALEDIAYVYFIVVIMGGIGDFLMPLLLFYGQQPVLALGSLAHLAAASLLFAEFVHDIGVINFNLFSFYAVWFHIGFIVAGLRLLNKPGKEYPSNPMKRTVPPKTLAYLFLVATVGSVLVSSFFTFIAPTLGPRYEI